MLKQILLTALAATLATGIAIAEQPSSRIVIPVTRTSPTSGKLMFTNYCSPCHGVDGRGNGPVAAALKVQPTDLTALANNNNGKFPGAHIVTVLQFGAEMPSHGTLEMPVWGPILGKMNLSTPQDRQLRISNLSRYLDTIQVK